MRYWLHHLMQQRSRKLLSQHCSSSSQQWLKLHWSPQCWM
jgi:hypothetical protein